MQLLEVDLDLLPSGHKAQNILLLYQAPIVLYCKYAKEVRSMAVHKCFCESCYLVSLTVDS